MTASSNAEVVGANLEATKSRLRVAYKNLRKCLSIKLNINDVASPPSQVRRGEI